MSSSASSEDFEDASGAVLEDVSVKERLERGPSEHPHLPRTQDRQIYLRRAARDSRVAEHARLMRNGEHSYDSMDADEDSWRSESSQADGSSIGWPETSPVRADTTHNFCWCCNDRQQADHLEQSGSMDTEQDLEMADENRVGSVGAPDAEKTNIFHVTVVCVDAVASLSQLLWLLSYGLGLPIPTQPSGAKPRSLGWLFVIVWILRVTAEHAVKEVSSWAASSTLPKLDPSSLVATVVSTLAAGCRWLGFGVFLWLQCFPRSEEPPQPMFSSFIVVATLHTVVSGYQHRSAYFGICARQLRPVDASHRTHSTRDGIFNCQRSLDAYSAGNSMNCIPPSRAPNNTEVVTARGGQL